MKLVIAEKPSVALNLAKVLGVRQKKDGYVEGNGYLVSWCVGHLIQMANPEAYDEKYRKWNLQNLPILPKEIRYEVSRVTRKQYQVLKKLLNSKNVESIVNACDAGREGELIFRLVYEQAGCTKPIQRLWISSMEDQAIRDGFAHLKDGHHFEALYDSATARAIADWEVGMNLSRLYSCLYKEHYSVGRVQTPTLYLIAERDNEILRFQKEKYYTVDLVLQGMTLVSDRIDHRNVAEQLANLIGETIALTNVEHKEKVIRPDKPYDLTTLQREANKLFGFSAKKTLNTLQSLYEKKFVTYPRTDSRYLTDDMKESARALLKKLEPGYTGDETSFNSIFDSSKVSDHYAVIPTIQSAGKDTNALSEDEQRLFSLVRAKFLASCAENRIESATKITYEYEKFTFMATGKTVVQEGFSRYFKAFGKEKAQIELPAVESGAVLPVLEKKISEKYTKPPQHFTEDTLLKAMEIAGTEDLEKGVEVERKGLGTPATRAGVIENLIGKGFVKRDKKQLLVTDKGNQLVTIVAEEFRSAKVTADWEMKLARIAQGKLSKAAFLSEIEEKIQSLIGHYQSL